jgi:NADH dehydrogenase
MTPAAPSRTRIVIVGAGFAGATCARRLERLLRPGEADVLLIDVHNFFVFTPLLVEAGIGSLEPRHVIVPIRQFLSRRTRFRMAEVTGVDVQARRVFYHMIGEDEPRVAEYDHLVLATGSVTSLPPVPGLAEHGYEIKSLADAVGLRDRAIHMLERANVCADEAQRRALLHFVVVGANYSGVETAGEFNEFLRAGARQYRNLKPSDVRVTVVERLPRILPAMPASLATYALGKLRAAGIDVRLETTVTRLAADHAVLSTGERLDAHTVVWAAGIAQNPLARVLPLPQDARGYLLCEADGRVRGQQNVWAIGDTAVNPAPGGGVYPPTAQAAVRQGTCLAQNIARVLRGGAAKPFAFRDLGAVSAIGCRSAVADIMGIRLSGFAAWWVWRTIYLLKMPTLSRKVRVMIDWTLELFFKREIVQLGLHARGLTPRGPAGDIQGDRAR